MVIHYVILKIIYLLIIAVFAIYKDCAMAILFLRKWEKDNKISRLYFKHELNLRLEIYEKAVLV